MLSTNCTAFSIEKHRNEQAFIQWIKHSVFIPSIKSIQKRLSKPSYLFIWPRQLIECLVNVLTTISTFFVFLLLLPFYLLPAYSRRKPHSLFNTWFVRTSQITVKIYNENGRTIEEKNQRHGWCNLI